MMLNSYSEFEMYLNGIFGMFMFCERKFLSLNP